MDEHEGGDRDSWPAPADPGIPRFAAPGAQSPEAVIGLTWEGPPPLEGPNESVIGEAALAWPEASPAHPQAGPEPGAPALAPVPPLADVSAAARAVRVREPYPVRFGVAFPERLSRLSTLFRPLLLVPLVPLTALVHLVLIPAVFLGWVCVALWRTYPPWLFQGVTGALGYAGRVAAYATLLTDRFPSFDERRESTVAFAVAAPPAAGLSRARLVLWKAILLVPHAICSLILTVAVIVLTVVLWPLVVIFGRYPRDLFVFVSGVHRWNLRSASYFASLTDRYPPYDLASRAPPSGLAATAISGAAGFLALGVLAGLLLGMASVDHAEEPVITVDYEALRRGSTSGAFFFTGETIVPAFSVALLDVTDNSRPYRRELGLPDDQRAVVFRLFATNNMTEPRLLEPDGFNLRVDGDAERMEATTFLVRGASAPIDILPGNVVDLTLVFVVPRDAVPRELRVDPPWTATTGARYVFE